MKKSITIFSENFDSYGGVKLGSGKAKHIHLGDFVHNVTACDEGFVGLPWRKPLRGKVVITCPKCIEYINRNIGREDIAGYIRTKRAKQSS